MSTRMAGKALSDTERNYANGSWGTGQYDADALAAKFGLDRSNEGRGEGHIWGRGPDGQETYLGYADFGLAGNDELIKAHSRQANPDEINHSSSGDPLSSSGDIKGALLNLWNSGGGAASAPAPVAVPEGIVYSDKTAKAKAGVAAFENTILPYQGDYITGRKDTNPSEDFMNEYVRQLNEYRKPRDPNQIDGPVYNPQSEEAAVAGFGSEGLSAYDLDFDRDSGLYFS